MWQKLTRKLRSLECQGYAVDPLRFGDPLAMRVDWTPTSRGVNNRTHRLVAVGSTRLQFTATPATLVLSLVILLAGIGVTVAAWPATRPPDWRSLDMQVRILLVAGTVVAVAGACSLWSVTVPIVFDKQEALFWRGRKTPARDGARTPGRAALGSIHALQIIALRCRNDERSYDSFELNLVLDDGQRIHVIGSSEPDRLRDDAAALAAFLGKPVWDGTSLSPLAPFDREWPG